MKGSRKELQGCKAEQASELSGAEEDIRRTMRI